MNKWIDMKKLITRQIANDTTKIYVYSDFGFGVYISDHISVKWLRDLDHIHGKIRVESKIMG